MHSEQYHILKDTRIATLPDDIMPEYVSVSMTVQFHISTCPPDVRCV